MNIHNKISRHSSLFTLHSSLITHHSSLITHHSSLFTLHSSLIIALCILCLTSCGTIYKPYESSYKLSSDTIPHWRQIFTDPCLQTLIDSTLKNNSDITLARLNIQKAEVAYKASKMGYLPSVAFGSPSTGSLQGSRTKYGSMSGQWGYDLGITASWELDVFGGTVTNTKRQSKAYKEYMQYYQQALECQLISSVATLYYQLLEEEKQLKIQQDMLALYEKTYDATLNLFHAGQYTIVAVNESKAQVENLKASILDISNNILNLKEAICLLMNVRLQDFRYGTIDDVPMPAMVTNGIPAEMLGNRPDIRAAEKQIETAYYDVQISRGSFYPGVTITAGGGWMNPKTWFTQFFASLTQPIFQRGKLTANLKTAQLSQQMAAVNFERKMLDAYYEVTDALNDGNLAASKKEHLSAQVAALKSSVEANQELMNNGQATYLEVLTSMQNYLTARTTEVTNQYNAAKSLIDIYGALGGR